MDFNGHLSPINKTPEISKQTNNEITRKGTTILSHSFKKTNWNTVLFYSLAFFIPIIIMLIVYICIGIYPFGGKTLLTIDLYHQYIDFFSYYRQSLSSLSTGNFFYSFSKALGGNMIGLYAYYLASPLNFIFLFFTTKTLGEAVLVLTLLKIGICGVTFAIMCKRMFKGSDIFVIIFSTCYALMAYNIVFQQNIMWLDGVIWLPMIILGIYNLINKNSFALYTVSLCIALLSNYYIGYMLCIFSILFFIYQMIISSDEIPGIKEKFQKIGLFSASSILAGGIAAGLLIPTFLSLQGGKATFDTARFSLSSNFEFAQLLQKLFIGEMDIDLLHQGLRTTLPDIFCGTAITALCFLYFFNKKISVKEKAASTIMLFFLIMSFHIKAIDLIWHGMSTPVGFLYRNAFIFSFFAIYLGYKTFINLSGITKGNLLSALGIFIAVGIFVNNFSLESLTAFEIYMTIIFFMLYALIIGLIASGKKNIYAFIAFMMIVAVEFEISGCLSLEDLSHVSRDTYVNAVSSMEKANARIKALDSGIYRIDKTYMRSRNDGMMHSYYTITHSSSTADFGTVKFLNKLGFRNESNIGNSYDYGSTLPATSLLSIKYILDNKNINFKYFEESGYSDANKIYKNQYALPLMFKGNKQVLNVKDSYDIFQIQNDLFSYLSGSGDVLTEITDVTVNMKNLTKTISSGNGNFTKNNEDEEAYIEFTFTAINDEEIYGHFPTEPISDSTVDVYVNGKKLRQHFDSNHLTYYDILNFGSFNAGEEVSIKFVLEENETNYEAYYFYALNMENFLEAYNTLSSDPMDIEIVNENHIKASVNNLNTNQLVFTSIPYDKGWKAYVDGQQVQPQKVMDSLMAIEMNAGNHHIELKYTPPGFALGMVISVISVVAFILLYNIKFRSMKKNK